MLRSASLPDLSRQGPTASRSRRSTAPRPGTSDDRRERVRPAPSSQVAAEKTAASLGYCLDERRRDLAGTAVHYGLGMAWGPVYGLLRRHGRMQPLGAGVLTGASLSLIVDEGLSPALGFSAPNRDYPPLPMSEVL